MSKSKQLYRGEKDTDIAQISLNTHLPVDYTMCVLNNLNKPCHRTIRDMLR